MKKSDFKKSDEFTRATVIAFPNGMQCVIVAPTMAELKYVWDKLAQNQTAFSGQMAQEVSLARKK